MLTGRGQIMAYVCAELRKFNGEDASTCSSTTRRSCLRTAPLVAYRWPEKIAAGDPRRARAGITVPAADTYSWREALAGRKGSKIHRNADNVTAPVFGRCRCNEAR